MDSLTDPLLDAYLQRINYKGSLDPDAQTLSALTRAHSQSIAFENIDILLGREISLQPDDIVHKLVTQQRGGYCFEQNLLFLRVLHYLGFVVRPGGGRVRLGVITREQIPARTHLFCFIDIEGQRWLSDVGFGSYSLTAALQLEPQIVQCTPHGERRFDPVGERWFYQGFVADQWQDLYEFNPNEVMHPADQKVANWYTQTHSDTHFTYRLSVSRALPGGGRAALLNRRLRQVGENGSEELVEITHAKQLAEVLEDVFLLNAAAVTKPLWKKNQVDRMSAKQLLDISHELSQAVDQLSWTTPSHVYNPLDYAWGNHQEYVRRYGGMPSRILMVGMNPGPWGMAQTGIPFGDVGFVGQWLQLSEPLSEPLPEQHPKYPIMGMECHRREGSGQRLWGWAQDRFETPERFFEQAFVWNYCPLLFLAQGRNLIPEKLKKSEREALTPVCDVALRAVIECLQPRLLVGIGRYAEQRIRSVMGADTQVEYLLHPSPASPQANKNWVQHADALVAEHFSE